MSKVRRTVSLYPIKMEYVENLLVKMNRQVREDEERVTMDLAVRNAAQGYLEEEMKVSNDHWESWR